MNLLLLMGFFATASAEEHQLRGPLMESERAATRLEGVAESMGMDARIVRTYQHGRGWQYSVWVSGFPGKDEAEDGAKRLAERGGKGVTVFGGAQAAKRPLPPPMDVLPPVSEILARVVRALGGQNAGRRHLASTEGLLFSFSRRLPVVGVVAEHRLLRVGEYLRLEINHAADAVEALTAVRGPKGDWILRGSELTPVGGAVFDATVEKVAPETIYRPLLALPDLLVADDQDFEVTGQEVVDYRNAIRLESKTRHGRMTMLVEVGSWLPRSISYDFDGGHTQTVFVGWKAVAGNLILPSVMEVRKDGLLLDSVRVQEIQLSPTLSPDDFSPPEMP